MEARNMMDSEEAFILLDVRTYDEFKEIRIDGSILIPDYEITSRAESELQDKNALIFVYCKSGIRSANTVNKLVDMGYMNVYDFGGIIDWPFDTVSD
jgi:rhodanese-related sulfurtransferase